MNRKSFGLALFVGTVLAAARADAALVTYKLVLQPGSTFSLYASDSIGDNGGLATIGVPLKGTITSIDNKAPFGQFASGPGGSGPIGFTEFRSADGSPNSATTITGAQLTVPTPTPFVVHGFGQTGGNLSTGLFGVFGSQDQLVYGAPLLIATGTYSGGAPSFDTASLDLIANVFTDAQSTNTFAAQISTQVVVPEPASIVTVGLGLLAVVAIRRRKA